MSENKNQIGRRNFLQAAAALGAGLTLGCNTSNAQSAGSGAGAATASRSPGANPGNSLIGFKTDPINRKIRLGLVGSGGRGRGLLRDFMRTGNVEIVAVCDVHEDRAARAKKMAVDAGHGDPKIYAGSDRAFEKLNGQEDIDLVINATPWDWHMPISVDGMKKGRHVAIEVPMTLSVEDNWQVVETAEKTRRHCMMLENCCYGEIELAVFNACKQGLFGELLHAEGGYLHDLRNYKFQVPGEGEWRRRFTQIMDGNLYPTHGLGPVALCLDINRGDKFDYVVSMSSPSKALHEYAVNKFGADDPRAKEEYKCGDVNTSLIKTANGKTFMVQHDTNAPRPYSRINMVRGTKGLFVGYPDRWSTGHQWGNLDEFKKKYQHPLFAKAKEGARQGGHGGMDYIMAHRLIDCLQRGLPLDLTVYDGASWSCLVELTCKSVADKSRPVDVPDFTRGAWKTAKPLEVVS